MTKYKFYADRVQSTPQTQPIPMRESEMLQGRSGGYMFDAGMWQLVRRALLTGTSEATYYAGKRELTDDFVNVIRAAVQEDPARVAEEILYASDGRSINNSAPLFALVLLSMGEAVEAKNAFRDIFADVVRTASHLYEFVGYVRAMRGWGRVIQETGRAWFSNEDVRRLAYQLLKYQSRHGFSGRDLLRLYHVKPATQLHDELFEWVTKGWDELPEFSAVPEPLRQIYWYEWLKRNPEQTDVAISEGRLTHEMAAPVGQMDRAAWQLLFEEMPIGALLRNLASLTEIGVLRADEPANIDRVEAVLNDKDHLRRGRIHPIDALKALKTYASGGGIGRSRKTWAPVGRVVDILEKSVELSFDVIEPTGKTFFHAVDVSGSMGLYTVPQVGLMPSEIAATMALVTAKAERNYMVRGFAHSFVDLGITAADSVGSATRKARISTFGATDASVAWDWMIKNQFKADVAVFWTDGESWAGRRHPAQALEEYRKRVNRDIEAVYVTLMPYRHTLADPKDLNAWALGGFDPSMPRLIQMIANGDV